MKGLIGLTAGCGLMVSALGACGVIPENLDAESAANALTRGAEFDNGTVEDGDIPEVTAPSVMLVPTIETAVMTPGQANIMSLEVQETDGEDVAATLVQFKGSKEHIRVEADEDDQDGTVENPFKMNEKVCEKLCNRIHRVEVFQAIELEGGGISVKVEMTAELDCREDGNEDLCEGEDVPEVDAGAGGAGGAGGSGEGGAGGSVLGGGGAPDPKVDFEQMCVTAATNCPVLFVDPDDPNSPDPDPDDPLFLDKCSAGLECADAAFLGTECEPLWGDFIICVENATENMCTDCTDLLDEIDALPCGAGEDGCFDGPVDPICFETCDEVELALCTDPDPGLCAEGCQYMLDSVSCGAEGRIAVQCLADFGPEAFICDFGYAEPSYEVCVAELTAFDDCEFGFGSDGL